uniref:Uncharacterized protein n=1 Tax=Arundo donax TaxID=35708 RepID=A0A0A8ZTC1_ARUDO
MHFLKQAYISIYVGKVVGICYSSNSTFLCGVWYFCKNGSYNLKGC